MFTDSKIFNYTFQPHGKNTTAWCKEGERPVVHTVKHPLKVHVYAGISIYGATPLFEVQGTSGHDDIGKSVTAAAYQELLGNCMLPAFENIMTPHTNRPIFQQDGATCHTAKTTKAYLQAAGIEVLSPWPARSPDLSPIENAWADLQRKINRKSITTFADFRREL